MRINRAQLRKQLEKWNDQLSGPKEFVVTHPAEMDRDRAIVVAKAAGMPEGKAHFHACFSLDRVAWRALH